MLQAPLVVEAERRVRKRFEPFLGDGRAADGAHAVGACVDPPESRVDLDDHVAGVLSQRMVELEVDEVGSVVGDVLVAGGGFKGGRAVGLSDEKGEKVKERPVYPGDLLGSMYLLAGIDAKAKLPHPWGLDAYVLDTENEGMKSAGMLEEIT